MRVPHQAILEFVAAVTRPIRGHVILKQAEVRRERRIWANLPNHQNQPGRAALVEGRVVSPFIAWKSYSPVNLVIVDVRR